MDGQWNRQVFGTREAKSSFPDLAGAYPVLSDVDLECLLGIQPMGGGVARQRGSVLMAEGQKPLGVHVLWDGRVKLSMSSENGKSLILGFASRGAVLGLPTTISGRPYGMRAEVVETAKVTFVSRDNLLRHLHATATAAYAAAELVSAIYYFVLAETRASSLPGSAEQKMARFLLGLNPVAASFDSRMTVSLLLTQEEIGQMIGVSRETVARMMSRFKKQRILEYKAPLLVIHDAATLAKVAEFPHVVDPDLKRKATAG